MAPSTLTAQAPTAPHTLVNEPINPLVSSTVAPQTEETQAATEVTCESAETPKDQKSVPLWARIYPVSQPPFEQVLKGHPGDIEPPHASDEFPESQASTEEVQRRKQEIDELENFNVKVGATDSENNVGYEHAWALPWNDQRFKSQWYKQQHLLPHKHSDPALRALNHTDREAFLHKPDVETEKLSPRFGSIIRGQGFDLTKLTSDELDELALFVTQRGVVQIDNQNAFINSGPDKLEEFARHFSQVLHEHPVAGRVQNHPKLLPIYRSDTSLNHLRAYKGSHGIQGKFSLFTASTSFTVLQLIIHDFVDQVYTRTLRLRVNLLVLQPCYSLIPARAVETLSSSIPKSCIVVYHPFCARH